MKMVWAVVRSSKADSIAERLKSMGAGGCTVTRVRGYGGEWHVYEPLIHGGHHKLEVIVEDDKADAVVKEIADHGYTGLLGDGIVSVFDVGSVVDIRSKQQVKSSDGEKTGGSKDVHRGETLPGVWKKPGIMMDANMRMRKHFVLLTVISILGSTVGWGSPRVVRAGENLALGESIYRKNCAACHGEKGDGKGPEADRLKTKPRDFTSGKYKFQSTPSGSLPLDEDILRTVSRGVRTTSMLAQLHLSENERWAVTDYLKSFSPRFKTEKPVEPLAIPAKLSFNSHLIAVGKAKYEEAGCGACHGADGKGDGPSSKELKDDSGNSISPTDLTLKPFKSGPEPQDLFRTISTGLNGTPMPSYADSLTVKERWALVSYVLSIATRDRPRGMMGLVGEEVQGMRIDMRAAMAGMMKGGGMMGRGGGMMDRNMRDMMKDMMRR